MFSSVVKANNREIETDRSDAGRWRIVTPELAADWLCSCAPNRNIVVSHVEFLSRQMVEGKWKRSGQPIIFGQSGQLLDGQHRLTACIKANVNISLLVVHGIDDEHFSVMDTGRARKASDVLSILNYKHASHLATAARLLIAWQTDRLGRSSRELGISTQQIVDVVKQIPDLVECLQRTLGMRILGPGTSAFFLYVFGLKDKSAADCFMSDLALGNALDRNDPVYVLRERLLVYRGTLAPKIKMAFTIKAWNAIRQNYALKQLKWIQEEKFPKIV